MRLAGQIMLVCLLLAALQALIAILTVAFVLLLVWGLLFRTRETVGLIAFCLFLEALFVHPFTTIGIIVLLAAIVLIANVGTEVPPDPQAPAALLPPPPPPGDDEG